MKNILDDKPGNLVYPQLPPRQKIPNETNPRYADLINKILIIEEKRNKQKLKGGYRKSRRKYRRKSRRKSRKSFRRKTNRRLKTRKSRRKNKRK